MKKTLIALMALAGVASAAGTGEFVVPTGGAFAAGDYAFRFTIDEDDVTFTDSVITSLNGGNVLAMYGLQNTGNYYTNGFVLNVENGSITLSVGRGAYANLNSSSAISSSTTYTIANDGVSGGKVMAGESPLTLQVGTQYEVVSSLEIVSNPQTWDPNAKDLMQTVTIFEAGNYDSPLASIEYKGNMNGGTANTAMQVWGNSAYNVTVPEPATATLSLLALAGLCARRRRA